MSIEQFDPETFERVRLELVKRRMTVLILALTCVWAGAFIILTGAPNFIETWFSPWSRYGVGGVAFVVGIITSVGGFIGDRSRTGWALQAIGLFGMMSWFVGMGAAYWGLIVAQGGLKLVGPGEELAGIWTGRGYVPIIYLGLALLALNPLVAMIKQRRVSRRHAAARSRA
jgi:MFS family permease